MAQIKLLTDVNDGKTNKPLHEGNIIDLGKERNEKAVEKKLAIWVDSSEFLEAKKEVEKEKVEGIQKTTTKVKGKKIETK